MSAQTQPRRITAPEIWARKGGEPIVCLTAYDAPMARLLDPHCDLLLVGDSVGMVVHGLDSTIGVTLDMMILHGQAVMRGAKRALVTVDMPFGSYEKSPQQAFENAARILSETGCQAIKIESGTYAAETIDFMAQRSIPVMGHIGLRPQAALADGGFKAKGRTRAERQKVIDEAMASADAGAFAIVVEGVAEDLALELPHLQQGTKRGGTGGREEEPKRRKDGEEEEELRLGRDTFTCLCSLVTMSGDRLNRNTNHLTPSGQVRYRLDPIVDTMSARNCSHFPSLKPSIVW